MSDGPVRDRMTGQNVEVLWWKVWVSEGMDCGGDSG